MAAQAHCVVAVFAIVGDRPQHVDSPLLVDGDTLHVGRDGNAAERVHHPFRIRTVRVATERSVV